jgi:hypothetical protein
MVVEVDGRVILVDRRHRSASELRLRHPIAHIVFRHAMPPLDPDTGANLRTFDRGSLCPIYVTLFNLLSQGRETGNWRREWDSNPR